MFVGIHKNTSSALQAEYITVTESPPFGRHNTDCTTAELSSLALPLFWLHILDITFTYSLSMESLRARYVLSKFSQYFAISCKEHFWTNSLLIGDPGYLLCVFYCFLVLITCVTCAPGLSANADSFKRKKKKSTFSDKTCHWWLCYIIITFQILPKEWLFLVFFI